MRKLLRHAHCMHRRRSLSLTALSSTEAFLRACLGTKLFKLFHARQGFLDLAAQLFTIFSVLMRHLVNVDFQALAGCFPCASSICVQRTGFLCVDPGQHAAIPDFCPRLNWRSRPRKGYLVNMHKVKSKRLFVSTRNSTDSTRKHTMRSSIHRPKEANDELPCGASLSQSEDSAMARISIMLLT